MDIIQLLPDSIANQIAAGEVIQRPASVVKELMENAIDAGGTQIELIIKNAGKTMIQIIDNGKGMSDADAIMCFERHATSKIKNAEDLFKIKTMGFRGEALASIASIAHVELLTKTSIQEHGTKIIVNGSKVEKQEAASSPVGTNLKVKNLFFNVPARRKFLKSDPTELKHIIDEFTRIALAHPEIHFSLNHNDNQLFHLPSGKLRQRIVSILGKNYNEKLVPVEEYTDWIKVQGFVGKPEASKRSKGEQYLFVNKRYIRSNYIQHAIRSVYEDLIPSENYPLFVLFLDIDPEKIDINVHPTKQEIKFDEERLVYNFVKVSVRHAIGKYTLTPVIDFEEGTNGIGSPNPPKFIQESSTQPSKSTTYGMGQSAKDRQFKDNLDSWQSVYNGLTQNHESTQGAITLESNLSSDLNLQEKSDSKKKPIQLEGGYILSQIKSGVMIIDRKYAQERILYERYLNQMKDLDKAPQLTLFSESFELPVEKAELLKSLLPEIKKLGFEIEDFGNNSFIARSYPVEYTLERTIEMEINQLLEKYIEEQIVEDSAQASLAKSLAIRASGKGMGKMTESEMHNLIDQLFACETPFICPSGRKCFVTIELDEIKKRFKQ